MGIEVERQQRFWDEVGPELANLKAGLLSKTPACAAVPAVPVGVPQQARGHGVAPQPDCKQHQGRTKFRMAPMPIPKFSGKVVDYPEFKTLFKDCVESQYEESAGVMILRN